MHIPRTSPRGPPFNPPAGYTAGACITRPRPQPRTLPTPASGSHFGCYTTGTSPVRANDRLIGQLPSPSTTNNWIRPVTLAHRHAALWQPAPNPDYTRSSPPPLSHCAASFCTVNSLLLARFELTSYHSCCVFSTEKPPRKPEC
jgi:hypothetical protein